MFHIKIIVFLINTVFFIKKMCYVVINFVIIGVFINSCQEIIEKLHINLTNELFFEKKTHSYV